jgi:hypothetical protein
MSSSPKAIDSRRASKLLKSPTWPKSGNCDIRVVGAEQGADHRVQTIEDASQGAFAGLSSQEEAPCPPSTIPHLFA